MAVHGQELVTDTAEQMMEAHGRHVQGGDGSVLSHSDLGGARQSEPFASESQKPGTCAAADSSTLGNIQSLHKHI